MRSRRLIILCAILLVLVGLVLLKSGGTGKTRELRKTATFAFADTANISKIVICKQTETITLQRSSNGWLLNGTTQAEPEFMVPLIKILSSMQASGVAAAESELQSPMAAEVSVFVGSKQVRHFLLGPTAQSGTCAKQLPKGKPYKVEVPGYQSLINLVYTVSSTDLRGRTLVSLPSNALRSIVMQNFAQPNESFILELQPHGFRLATYPDGINITNVDTLKVVRFVEQFASKKVETYISQTDDITAANRLTISLKDGSEMWFETCPIMQNGQIDPNRLIVRTANAETAIATYFELDPILKRASYFVKKR